MLPAMLLQVWRLQTAIYTTSIEAESNLVSAVQGQAPLTLTRIPPQGKASKHPSTQALSICSYLLSSSYETNLSCDIAMLMLSVELLCCSICIAVYRVPGKCVRALSTRSLNWLAVLESAFLCICYCMPCDCLFLSGTLFAYPSCCHDMLLLFRWCALTGQNFTQNHAPDSIDFAAVHIWPDLWTVCTPCFCLRIMLCSRCADIMTALHAHMSLVSAPCAHIAACVDC